jgi:hypothetical protein
MALAAAASLTSEVTCAGEVNPNRPKPNVAIAEGATANRRHEDEATGAGGRACSCTWCSFEKECEGLLMKAVEGLVARCVVGSGADPNALDVVGVRCAEQSVRADRPTTAMVMQAASGRGSQRGRHRPLWFVRHEMLDERLGIVADKPPTGE